MTLQVGSGSGSEINSFGSATLLDRVVITDQLLKRVGFTGPDSETQDKAEKMWRGGASRLFEASSGLVEPR